MKTGMHSLRTDVEHNVVIENGAGNSFIFANNFANGRKRTVIRTDPNVVQTSCGTPQIQASMNRCG